MDSNQDSEGKDKGGRPTKYTDTTIDQVLEYLDSYKETGEEIPSIAGLAVVLGVRRETVHAWRNDPEKWEFSNIIDRILAEQEIMLVNKGLNGAFNSNITKLILGKHGYHDKQDHEHSGPGGAPMAIKWEVQPVKAIEPPKGDDDDTGHAQGADGKQEDTPA